MILCPPSVIRSFALSSSCSRLVVQRNCCVGRGGEIVMLILGDIGTPLMEDALARMLSMLWRTVGSPFECLVMILSLISCARIVMSGSPNPPRVVGV